MDKNNQKYQDDDRYTQEDEKCPECGGNIVSSFAANGPDDYSKVWECKGCGETWTN